MMASDGKSKLPYEAVGDSAAPAAPASDLWGYLRVIHRRRWWLVAAMVASVGWALYSYASTETTWMADAKILVAPDQGLMRFSPDMTSFLPDPFLMGAGNQPATQVAILHSQPVMDAALTVLRSEPDLVRSLTDGSRDRLSPLDTRELLDELSSGRRPDVTSDPQMAAVVAALKVNPVNRTNVIEVTTWSTDAQLAHDYVNALCAAYLVKSLERTQRVARTALGYVRSQLRDVRKRLANAEDGVAEYGRETGIFELGTQAKSAVEAVAGLEGLLLDAQTNLRALKAEQGELRKQITGQKRETVESAKTLVSNPLVTSLQQQLVELNLERGKLLETFTAGSTKVQAVDAQIASVKAAIAKEVEQVVSSTTTVPNPVRADLLSRTAVLSAEIQAAQAVISPLQAELSSARAALRDVPDEQVELARRQREYQLAESHYLLLRKKEEEYVLAQEAQVGGAELIEPARLANKERVGPGRLTTLLLGVIGGFCIGLLLVFTVEYIQDTYPDVHSSEINVGLPAIAMVPTSRSDPGSSLAQLADPDKPFRESFLSLYSNLRFASPGGLPHTVCITSAQKGDGKSTVAANLAMAATEAGISVLLVDGDLRQPSIQDMLELEQVPGLSCVLEETSPMEDAIHEVSVGEKHSLTVLPAGSCPAIPQTLLDSSRMDALLRDWSEQFDLVVIDAPPLGETSDAQIIASKSDATLLVFDLRKTRRIVLRGGANLLTRAGANVLGLVANHVPRKRGPYYYT